MRDPTTILRHLIVFGSSLLLDLHPAIAAVTLEYVGEPFDSITDETPPVGTTYTYANRVTARVVLSGPLPPNQLWSAPMPVSVLSIEVSDGVHVLTEANADVWAPAFGTGPDGEILQWGIVAMQHPPDGEFDEVGEQDIYIQTLYDLEGLDSADAASVSELVALPSTYGVDAGRKKSWPGAWTVTPTPQCEDGVDNDGDGLSDLADPDCGDPLDDSEWSLSAGDLVVADTAGRIVRVDPITGSSIVMFDDDLVGPRGVAFDDQGRLLVADSGVFNEFGNADGALYRYDLDSGSRETLPVPLDNPVDVAVGPDGTIAVTDFSLFDFGGFAAPTDPQLWRFDPIAETATSTPLATSAPFAVAVDAAGDALVATPSISLLGYIPGEVVRVTPGGSETRELSSGIAEDPRGLALDADGSLLISTYATGALGRWDPVASAETPLATFAPGFWGLDVAADGQVVAAGADGTIQRIDPLTGTVTLLASGGELVFPYGITVVRAACSDGFDNDGDGLVDHPADPGCRDASWAWEDPACDDGLDNDGDGLVDWDGDGMGGSPDPHCTDSFMRNEAPPRKKCGLGTELAFGLLLALAWRRLRADR